MTKDLSGCGTALVTPFRADGAVDFESYRSLVRRQLEAQVDFLVPCGATGEELSLTNAEYLELIRVTAETASGAVPIVPGLCESSTDKAIAKAREVCSLGADALLVVSPPYLRPTQEGIYQHFRAIVDAVSVPIIIYDVPGRTATHICPEIVLRLAELPTVVGMKDASGSLLDSATVAFNAPKGFRVFSGHDGFTLPLLTLGAQGVISVAANLVPTQIAAAVRLSLSHQHEEAREMYRRLWPLISALSSEVSPLPVKCALSLLHRAQEHCRLPLLPLPAFKRRKMHDALVQCGLLVDSDYAIGSGVAGAEIAAR